MVSTASPSGAQVIFDGANPRIIQGVAAEDILAGALVVSSAGTTAQKVGSVTSTYSPQDIEFTAIKDGIHCNGIALQTVSSGTTAYVSVATRGTYLLRAAGIISGGQPLSPVSGTTQGVAGAEVLTVTSGTVSSTGTVNTTIGRSLTNSASGTNLYILGTLSC